MKTLAEQLADYCREHPIQMDGCETILEVLFWAYTETHPIDNEKIKDGYARLREQLYYLSPKKFDGVFDIASDICTESGLLAFQEGLRLGASLMMELAEE